MPDLKISGLTALTAADTADLLEIVDVSDTTMAATGTNKKITAGQVLASGLPGSFSTLAASGQITSTKAGGWLVNAAATTGYSFIQMANTSGSAYFGVESSTGSTIIIGASAYDTSIAGKTALSFSADNGASLGMRFSSTGLAVTGALSATNKATIGTIVSGETDVLHLYENGGSSRGDWSFKLNGNRAFYIKPNATDGSSAVFVIENAASTKSFQFGTDTGTLKTPSTISVGNATPSTSGAGITFPATQSASTDPNTLDDWEEGTFDVAMTCGTSGTITLDPTVNRMAYTKVGRNVTISGFVLATSVSSPVGSLTMTGLPFPSYNGDEGEGASAVALRINGWEASTPAIQALIQENGTTILVESIVSGTAGNAAAYVKANSSITINATYITAT